MGTIFYGGSILTMDARLERPEAVYVEKGRIRYVGTLAEARHIAGSKATLTDLQGHCLMPGFIDAHSHIVLNGQMGLMADLSECANFADVAQTMARYIEENKITPKGIAIGRGYDQNFLEELAHPGKAVLDTVSTTIPIMILHVSGHLACVNSAMLKVAGIDENTPDPQGGKIGRIPGSNEPDGLLEESAMMSSQALIGKRMKIDFGKMLTLMQQTYVAHGVTTAQEGSGNRLNLILLRLAQLLGKLTLDVVFYPLVGKEGQSMLKKAGAGYKKHIKLGGYKMILDGSPQGRTAWMSQPYLGGEEGYCGYPWLKDEEVYAHILTALQENRQILAHCNGDAASEQFLNAYEKALEQIPNTTLRPVMIHCQTVREDQLDRMAKIAMIPSVFVGHVYYWGDIHLRNFGPERGHRISPVKDTLDRGMVVNFHQDTPITKPNMLHSVWAAVNRQSRMGVTIGEAQKAGVYDALKAVTINAAYAYFEEDSKGSITAGKRADLVILDRDPTAVEPMEIRDIQVLQTIKDGKTIYAK